MFKQQNFGLPLRDAMTQMLDRVPSQDLRVLVTGMLVQKETGGNLAEILDRTAEHHSRAPEDSWRNQDPYRAGQNDRLDSVSRFPSSCLS